jgi:arsenite methyltransferase
MAHLPDGLTADAVRAAVRDRYSEVGADPSQSFTFPVGRQFAEAVGYPVDLLECLPPGATGAFAGVACPVPHAALTTGETVLDLGCGGGLDSLYAGTRVGPSGHVVGIDFAPAMIARAQQSLVDAGMPWVEARLSDGSCLPLSDSSVDAALVNGIFNLNPDKQALLAEVHRVLKPGGRLVGAEIILTAPLPPEAGHSLDDWFR